jgi:hypothetical protein
VVGFGGEGEGAGEEFDMDCSSSQGHSHESLAREVACGVDVSHLLASQSRAGRRLHAHLHSAGPWRNSRCQRNPIPSVSFTPTNCVLPRIPPTVPHAPLIASRSTLTLYRGGNRESFVTTPLIATCRIDYV